MQWPSLMRNKTDTEGSRTIEVLDLQAESHEGIAQCNGHIGQQIIAAASEARVFLYTLSIDDAKN